MVANVLALPPLGEASQETGRGARLPVMTDFLEEQAKRLYGLGELEGEALEVLRLIVRQTERVRTWTSISSTGQRQS